MSEKARGAAALKALAIISVVFFLGVVTVNALANTLPINGVNTGQLSDEIPNLFVPAGLTFSIWGLIYLLLAGYAGALLFAAFRSLGGAWGAVDAGLFIANMAGNIGWILAWHYRMVGLAMILMLLILASLAWLQERNWRRSAKADYPAGRGGAVLRFLLSTPINVYLGWICVATIANATALLVSLGWDGFGLDPRAWTVIVISAGMAIGLLFIFLRKAVAAPLVIVWAYAGIVIKRLGADPGYSAAVWIAAIAGATLLLAALAARLFFGRVRS
jgi:hypothetical protein